MMDVKTPTYDHSENFAKLDMADGKLDGHVDPAAVVGFLRQQSEVDPTYKDAKAGITMVDMATIGKDLALRADEITLLQEVTFPNHEKLFTSKGSDLDDLKAAFTLDATNGQSGAGPLAYIRTRFGTDATRAEALISQLPEPDRLRLAEGALNAEKQGTMKRSPLAMAIYRSISLDTVTEILRTDDPHSVFDDHLQLAAYCLDALPATVRETALKACFAGMNFKASPPEMEKPNQSGSIRFAVQLKFFNELTNAASSPQTREQSLKYGVKLSATLRHLDSPHMREFSAIYETPFFKESSFAKYSAGDYRKNELTRHSWQASLQSHLIKLIAADPIGLVDFMTKSGSKAEDLVGALTAALRGDNHDAVKQLEAAFEKIVRRLRPAPEAGPAKTGEASVRQRQQHILAANALGYLMGAANNAADAASDESFSLLRTIIVKGIANIPYIGGAVPESVKHAVAEFVDADNDKFNDKSFFVHAAAGIARVLRAIDGEYADAHPSENPLALSAGFKTATGDFKLTWDISKD